MDFRFAVHQSSIMQIDTLLTRIYANKSKLLKNNLLLNMIT